MKEIKSLIERAKKYIKSAEILLREGDYESSVSRTYYAMFYGAQAVLLTKNMSFSSHNGVISAFGEHFVKTNIFPKEMGRELNRAFEKRQLGDYEYTFVISEAEAKELLDSGKNFIEKIIQYLREREIL
jgi:uncharacterized protein (UPF0332 family)